MNVLANVIFLLIMCVIIPIACTIRVPLYMWQGGMGVWQALLVGMLACTVYWIVFSFFLMSRWLGVSESFAWASKLRFLFWIIIAANLYFVAVVPLQNLKHGELKSEYQQVHPILRLGVRYLALIDKSLIVTDMSRAKGDYAKMKLKPLERSKHYPQVDGWVYAVDLRTKHKSPILNYCVQAYFQLMGFETLRHDGTYDHLHISLRK